MSAIIILSVIIVLNVVILILYRIYGGRMDNRSSKRGDASSGWESNSTLPPTFR